MSDSKETEKLSGNNNTQATTTINNSNNNNENNNTSRWRKSNRSDVRQNIFSK